jgi:antitoxin HicB
MVTSIEHKPLEYYLSLKYQVSIEEAPEGGYFIQIKDLPGCMSQGETIEEALENMKEARQLWIESMYEDGHEIPLPGSAEKQYSGKFNIRIPKSLHRKLDEMAEQEGVSLNHYLVSTLSRVVGMDEGQRGRARKTRVSKQSSN